MSRSRRKIPKVGVTTARSDKSFKVGEHRSERRTLRAVITASLNSDDRRLYAGKKYSDPWMGDRDGKMLTAELGELLASNAELARKLHELERKLKGHDEAISAVLSAIRELMNPPQPKRRSIGYTADLEPTK